MNVISLSDKMPKPLDSLKKLVADFESGAEGAPEKFVMIVDSGESFSIYAQGANELEEIGLVDLCKAMLQGQALSG